ncbi:MAG: hypothetical protein JNJ59_08625 [Deltaproteobacteria bacterium]|jgi:hypothetical protein|nr:hypothetical protein [Deltaproteobacteria bacterium]
MPNASTIELRKAGVAFDDYRELARPVHDAHGAQRWPMLALTDQVLVAQRWKREALARPVVAASVTPLPQARPSSEPSSDWFLAAHAAQSPVRNT